MFDWQRFFPFQQFSKNGFRNTDPKDVEHYIHQVMTSVFGPRYEDQFPFRDPLSKETPVTRETPVKETDPFDIFETVSHIFVKIPLTREQLDLIKIKHTSQTLILENYPEEEQQKKIVLPSLVRRKGTKAVFKDDILEIMFLKNEDFNLSEIEISY
ncbi:spore gernimation protein GerT [Bacillus sp. CLL-7-23]|uniref:Spore gernimation protein GerT n=1 Tax=Bacillus changyiensis TaxID=3004103 RepID=A0ABT4X8N5_9BACI|nr:spore gernimation protein GerT [Bacillus changyiensis]MDA7027786.1 spore gernimation protein GerT [Bacillus changyiensis]